MHNKKSLFIYTKILFLTSNFRSVTCFVSTNKQVFNLLTSLSDFVSESEDVFSWCKYLCVKSAGSTISFANPPSHPHQLLITLINSTLIGTTCYLYNLSQRLVEYSSSYVFLLLYHVHFTCVLIIHCNF